MNRIKELREEAGISQQKLAEKVGATQQAVGQWEQGICMPRADKLPEIAKVLECDVSDLFKTKVR